MLFNTLKERSQGEAAEIRAQGARIQKRIAKNKKRKEER